MTRNLTLEQNITADIKRHLRIANLLPPTADYTTLAGELTQVVFDQLQEAGVDLAAWTRTDAAVKGAGAPGAR